MTEEQDRAVVGEMRSRMIRAGYDDTPYMLDGHLDADLADITPVKPDGWSCDAWGRVGGSPVPGCPCSMCVRMRSWQEPKPTKGRPRK